jgi:hypothetical protein
LNRTPAQPATGEWLEPKAFDLNRGHSAIQALDSSYNCIVALECNRVAEHSGYWQRNAAFAQVVPNTILL